MCVLVVLLLTLVLQSTQDLADWHTTTLFYIYICFHDYHMVVYIIVLLHFYISLYSNSITMFKTLKQSLMYRLAGLLQVTCVGVIGHLLHLKV